MKILVALKWRKSLNTSVIQLANVAYKQNVIPVAYQANNCESKYYSTRLTSNGNDFDKLYSRCCKDTNARNFSITNALAKSKDREKKKKGGKAQHIDTNELSQNVDVDKLTSRLEDCVVDLKNNFIKHLTLRSSTGSIEQVTVVFDGQEYLLQELVQIARKPKTVVLNVSSFPQAIPQVLEALRKSGMNLNPQQDGTTIFVPIPKVTKEHRENLSKNAKALFIKCRDNIKDVRNKEIRNLKKKPSVSEDLCRRLQAQIEAFSDQYINEAEKLLETKQKELIGSSD